MKTLFPKKPVFLLCVLLMTLLASCGPTPETKAKSSKMSKFETESQVKSVLGTKTAKTGTEKAAKAKAPADPNIIATIGYFTITKDELEKRILAEIYPRSYDSYNEKTEMPDNETVLLKMVAEKAMIMEGRKQGYLQDPSLASSIKQVRDRRLATSLRRKYIQYQIDKITASESEIEQMTEEMIQQMMKRNPKLDKEKTKAELRTRAEARVKNEKARKLLEEYYKEISKKNNVVKLSDNFFKTALIHQRLLSKPKKPRNVKFIRNYQVEEELTDEEKNLVLATYGNGEKITLKDWFDTLCQMSPPSRPKNLSTSKGVEEFIDKRVLIIPVHVAEAESLGLDKDESFLKDLREYEDKRLQSKVMTEKYKEVSEPTKEQILAYYNKNKEAFITGWLIKIDQIRCENLQAGRQAKAELDNGKDFEAVKEKYSLDKGNKPFNVYPTSEGMFWDDLWAGEPNEIIGPIKGFYRNSITWRIVKILEKKTGELKEYTDNTEMRIKSKMKSEKVEALMKKFRKELLKKYPYEIYADRIKDINPLDIP